MLCFILLLVTCFDILMPPYHKLVSVTFLLNLFVRITKVKLIAELNNPTAAEKEYCLLTRPILYT